MSRPVDLAASPWAPPSADALAGLDDDAFDAQVDAYVEAKRAIERAGLALLRAASKRGAHARHGFRDAAAWFASLSGDRRGAVHHDAELAATLEASSTIGEAFEAGKISKAAARELAFGADLPEPVLRNLTAQAATTSIEALARAVKQAKLAHGKGKPPKPSETAISRNPERVRIESDLDVEDGEVLDVAINAAMERMKLPKETPIAQRRAIALVSIGRYFLEHVDDPAMTRVGRPHLIAVVNVETLAGIEAGTARLASGTPLSAHAARRIACDANVSRVIMRGKSEVLDVGRASREPTVAMAKAVIARDQHCTEPDCHAPPWACEIHHERHWGS
ncbi:MAG TPA: hypothetical protein VK461_13805, partial [Acidimicrobiales bacterium]|nr:hypothetical protein [Acidimicrobiales bacterium]